MSSTKGYARDISDYSTYSVQEIEIFLLNLNVSCKSTAPRSAPLVFGVDKVKMIAVSLKTIVRECDKDPSCGDSDAKLGEFACQSVDAAQTALEDNDVQKMLLAKCKANQVLNMKVQLAEKGLDSWNKSANENGSGSETQSSDQTWLGRVRKWVQWLCKKVWELASSSFEAVVGAIMKCFNVVKQIAWNILDIIKRSFSIMWESLVHPEGALRKHLLDPALSSSRKTMIFVELFSSMIVKVLLTTCTIVPDPTLISPIAAAAFKAACPRLE